MLREYLRTFAPAPFRAAPFRTFVLWCISRVVVVGIVAYRARIVIRLMWLLLDRITQLLPFGQRHRQELASRSSISQGVNQDFDIHAGP